MLPGGKDTQAVPRPPNQQLYRDFFVEVMKALDHLQLSQETGVDELGRGTLMRKVKGIVEPIRVRYTYRWLMCAMVHEKFRARYVKSISRVWWN